jgi:hypothetical protein
MLAVVRLYANEAGRVGLEVAQKALSADLRGEEFWYDPQLLGTNIPMARSIGIA